MESTATSMQKGAAMNGFLRTAGAAKYLSVSERTVREWQARGILPFAKPSRKCCLFAVSDLDRAIAKFTVRAVGDGEKGAR